jgi:hypothetical protein
MECEFCKKTFSSKGNLTVHQKSAKYCLDLQGKDKNIMECEYCNKNFSLKQTLLDHYNSCKEKQKKDYTKQYEIEVNALKDKLEEKNELVKELLQIIRDSKIVNDKVKTIEQRFRRDQYPGKNFIYILTTPHHEKERTYIFGKTINLTNRLSTYNKSEEHTVVYYKECKNEHVMNSAETAVFSKLDAHRAMKNRERFILPENSTIDFFIKTVDDCIEFFSN